MCGRYDDLRPAEAHRRFFRPQRRSAESSPSSYETWTTTGLRAFETHKAGRTKKYIIIRSTACFCLTEEPEEPHFQIMISIIRNHSGRLSAAHARIAALVLEAPEVAVRFSVAELARRARVSEPTVNRFCRELGLSGYREFRQVMLSELENGRRPAVERIAPTDSVEEGARKVFAATVRALEEVRDSLPFEAVRQAAVATLKARWVHIYGFGASATVAADAQHKLYRLAAMTVAHADAHMQAMAAATLGPEDVVIAISISGRTRELIETVRLAHENGATIIALTRSGSPLAKLASILLPIDLGEPREIYTPLTARTAQLAVVDALVVGVTLLSPPTVVAERLARMDAAIQRRRLRDGEAPGDGGLAGSPFE
jgi:RpiR family transcriptional regulator, carbohydrate utilization regulator